MRKLLLNPFAMFIIGLCAGILSRLLDIYTQNLGEIFSQMAAWILLGTLISIYSETSRRAAANTLTFCLGMLITYYAVAALSHGVYDKSFIIGWTIFALCSPVLAYFTWMTKSKGVLPRLISIGIVAVSVLSSILLFDGFRIYDLLIDGCLIYVLFFVDVQRGTAGRRIKKR
ncbi:MAG: DUF6518 family protein [Lachnospiraceae bacterium]